MTTPSPQVRALLYGRTSLDKSKGKSVDDQLAGMRSWADREGHIVVGELRDDGISASRYARTKARPDWQKAMDLIAAGELDLLSVWEISRATRDRMVWASLVAACIEAKVKIAVDCRVYDVEDPDDAYFLDQMVASGTRESALTSKRTLRGVRSRAASGRPHGRLNYGYRVEYDPTTGKAIGRVVDETEAEVIKETARRLLGGHSAFAIAADLNANEVPSPRGAEWKGSNITRMIQAPALAGLRVHRGEVLDGVAGTWKPILDIQTHRALAAMLSDPERRATRTGTHIRHLAPGVAVCGVCGGPVRSLNRKLRSGGRRIVYNCRNRWCFSRIADEVDEIVEGVMIGVLSRADLTAKLTDGDPQAVSAAAEVARMTAKLEEARRLVSDELLSLASLVDLERRYLPKIEEAKRAARPRHIPSVVLDTAGPDAAALWAALPVTSKREIIRVLAHVKIHRSARRGIHMPVDVSAVEITPRM